MKPTPTEKQLVDQLLTAMQVPAKTEQRKETKVTTKKQKRTLLSILWSKHLDQVEIEGINTTLVLILKTILALVCISWLIQPDTITNLLLLAFEWRNYLILKITSTILIISYIEILGMAINFTSKLVFGFIRQLILTNKNNAPKRNLIVSENSINGIPHNELINHLFDTGNFKRSEIESKFSIPRRKYETLARALEKLGIIQKDKTQNNAFMFVNEFTRQDLATILLEKTEAKDLDNFASQIEQTLVLSPTPNFTSSNIA